MSSVPQAADSSTEGWRQFSSRRKTAHKVRQPKASGSPGPIKFGRKPLFLIASVAVILAAMAPRVKAAWQLNHWGSLYADYALCMVGPTGPQALLNESAEYLQLLRRRVVASPPDAQPFKRCIGFSEQFSSGSEFIAAHELSAASFREFSGDKSKPISIQTLSLDLKKMKELEETGGFLLQKSLKKLLKPSRHAKEAIYPPAPAAVSFGSGLGNLDPQFKNSAAFGNHVVVSIDTGVGEQTFVSNDKGLHFQKDAHPIETELRGACRAAEGRRSYSLTANARGEKLIVYREPEKRPRFAALLADSENLISLACDRFALVALVTRGNRKESTPALQLKECRFGQTCTAMRQPSMHALPLRFPADVERIAGDTVLSLVTNGIVRVSSSRDAGSHWTPWTVAYDGVESGLSDSPPYRLLKLGDDLLLYGTPNRTSRYPLLVSPDHGASFQPHALEASSLALNPRMR